MADDNVPDGATDDNTIPKWKRYYLANRAACIAARSDWQRRNRDRINAAARAKTSTPEELAKRRERDAAWRAANPERVVELNRQRSAVRSAERKAKRDAKPKETPEERSERIRAYKRAWATKQRAENPGARKASKKAWAAQWRINNKETASRAYKEWRQTNPEKARAIRLARRARSVGAEGKHTAEDIKSLLEVQGRKCAHSFCRVSIKGGYHVDHIMPLARGGSNDKRNIQLLCAKCNTRKHAKHPVDFALENGMLV